MLRTDTVTHPGPFPVRPSTRRESAMAMIPAILPSEYTTAYRLLSALQTDMDPACAGSPPELSSRTSGEGSLPEPGQRAGSA